MKPSTDPTDIHATRMSERRREKVVEGTRRDQIKSQGLKRRREVGQETYGENRRKMQRDTKGRQERPRRREMKMRRQTLDNFPTIVSERAKTRREANFLNGWIQLQQASEEGWVSGGRGKTKKRKNEKLADCYGRKREDSKQSCDYPRLFRKLEISAKIGTMQSWDPTKSISIVSCDENNGSVTKHSQLRLITVIMRKIGKMLKNKHETFA